MIKSYFSDIAKKKQTFDKITETAASAKKYEQKFGKNKTINGTIGMFKDEDENIYIPSIIDNLSKKFSLNQIAPYSPMNGTESFYKGIINLLNLKDFEKYILIHPVAGGMAALHHMVHNFNNCKIVTHSPYWGPYKNIVEELGLTLHTINFFKNNLKEIDFENIEKQLSQFKGNKILFIINNPSNNPTGTSFTLNEWKKLRQILINLEKKYNINFLLFFDLAYIDYSNIEFTDILEIFFNDFNIFAGFSISKSFSLYGFRTGALIYFAKSNSDKNYVLSKFNYSSRASTGSINSFGYKIIESFSDKSLIKILRNEQNLIKHIINKRSKLFIHILEEYNLNYYRYDSGFFITFIPDLHNKSGTSYKNNKTNNRNKTKDINKINNKFSQILKFEKKLEKLGIFFVPTYNGIRVAICSLNIKKINLFSKIIKENKNKIFNIF